MSMRVLHTSDWHLGQKFINKDRDAEHRLALEWLLLTVENEKIDLLIVAGDIFDTYNPPASAVELYFNFLVGLLKTKCRHVVITGGNHDSPATLNAPKQLLKAFNIHVIGGVPKEQHDQILVLKNSKGAPECIVVAVPFLRDGDLLQALSGESGLERVERIRKGILRHYQDLSEQLPTEPIPVLVTGHLYAKGAQAAAKQDNIYIGDISNIEASQFPAAFDYVALGHIHRSQQVGQFEHIRYSGSLLPLSFSEVQDQKSVTVITFEKKKIQSIELKDVPVFRRLKSFSGTLTEVLERMNAFSKKHQHELMPWVEVIIEDEAIPPDLDAMLREQTHHLHLEILKFRVQRSMTDTSIENFSVDLSTLDELEVFRKLCERNGIDLGAMQELEATFRELRTGIPP